MPLSSDFIIIKGDITRRVGDKADLWEETFDIKGRYCGGDAVLMFMVKGLTITEQTAQIRINNKKVGEILPYTGAYKDHWFTQIINIGTSVLKDGENKIQISAVGWEGASSSNLYDDFFIRDVICFFK